jgi:alpha-galactosidase
MDNALAQKILDADEKDVEKLWKQANWYNSTEISYKEGLKKRDDRLMGKKVGKINAGGSLTAKVKRHSVEMFRLRSVGHGGKRKVHAKEEL